jgi:hypothetical protein
VPEPDDGVRQTCQELRRLYDALGAHYGARPTRQPLDAPVDATVSAYAAAADVPTADGDGQSRRGVPGPRVPGAGLLDVVRAAENVHKGVLGLAWDVHYAMGRKGKGWTTREALRLLPDWLDALPEDHPAQNGARGRLGELRQRARRVLGENENVIALAIPCPTVWEWAHDFDTEAGWVRGDFGCWNWDQDATERLGRAVSRRSTLLLPVGRTPPVVCCFVCGYRSDPRDDAEISDAVMAHLEAVGVVPS